MNVGVATVQDSSNFGSFLQAYALQKVLQDMGHEVFFIRTRSREYVDSLYHVPLRSMFRHPLSARRRAAYAKNKHLRLAEAQRCFQVIEQDEADGMDLVVLGSDEIWNVNLPAFTQPVFYGLGMRPPAMAYAVSAGRATLDQMRAHPALVRAISDLRRILARDEDTASMVEAITGARPSIVCDPTLLLEVDAFSAPYHHPELENQNYLAVYAYRVDAPLRKKIRDFARARNLKVVSPCFYLDWADLNPVCGPLEFCAILSGAQYVVTTTFHGSIFSALNQTRFVSLPASRKTNDLLARLGLEDRILPDDLSDFDSLLDKTPIDYAAVRKRILDFRASSMALLADALADPGRAD